jgi:acyl-CoA synthetase (AMP-forming)/AMP-acid ligase II/acyl carrier protein
MREFGTIPELLDLHAAERPGALAVGDLERTSLTYRGLEELTRRVASQLSEIGLGRGDRVAIVLPNGPETATSFLAVTRLAIAAPLNPGLTRSELAFYLDDLDARAVIVAEDDTTDGSDAARELGIVRVPVSRTSGGSAGEFWLDAEPGGGGPPAQPTGDDVALVLHTSGTTAKPKIVPLTHRNLCASAANIATTLRLGPDDRAMNVMPLFHIHGLVAALLSSLSQGASVVCTPGFQAPSFFEWFERVQPTWYTAVPTMHQAILARAGDAERAMVRGSDLRFVRSSSASLAPTVLRDVEEAFGVPVVEAYGMTEAAHQMACNPLPPAARKPGSVGPAAGPEVAIADEAGRLVAGGQVGEVVIRGANVTAGYHGIDDRSSHFFGDGWFRTGDLGYLDPDGYLFLTGRKKEIINRGGETIAPRAIDEALLEHPHVTQAMAFSVPDPELGEEVAAVVTLAESAEESEPTLQDFLLDRLSWSRMPKRILLLDEIPKGATGKLQRIGMAERLGLEHVRKPDAGSDVATGDGASEATVARVAALWKDVLKDDRVGPDDDFLDAGGDSVTATALVVRVEQEFSVKLPLMAFFDATTARRQAALIDRVLAGRPAG